MVGNEGDFVAIDDWSRGGGSRERSMRTSSGTAWPADRRSSRDAFETLRSSALDGRSVGDYYYDNGHEYEQQLDGMTLIEPYLASPSVIVVDDTDWERVERAVDDYLT
jgi:hypothetical protein